MNHLKPETSGIDCSIKAIQEQLYPSLVAKWGELDMYGRAYRNPKKRKYIPEVFEGKEYKEMYLDAKELNRVFFIDGTVHENIDEGLFRTTLKMVFILDLEDFEGRRDDKVQMEAFQSIQKDVYVTFEIKEIEKTIEKVFSGFDTSRIMNDDMHPYHIFSINGDLTYELLNTC